MVCEGDLDSGWVVWLIDCTQPGFRLPYDHVGLPDPGEHGVGVSTMLACHSLGHYDWCRVHQAEWNDKMSPCHNAGGGNTFACVKFDKIKVIEQKAFEETGIWAALPAGRDETGGKRPKEFAGIHVHCRKKEKLPKCIDATFRAVRYVDENDVEHLLTPTASAALLFAREYGLSDRLGEVKCPRCNTIQDDTVKSYLEAGHVNDVKEALEYIPQRTKCQCCGSQLDRSEPIISNSLFSMSTPHEAELVEEDLLGVNTDDLYIQLYSSTAALKWTRKQENVLSKQVVGVHVHTYSKATLEREVDETYGRVAVNGQDVDRNKLLANMFRATLGPPPAAAESDHLMELLDN